MVGSWGYCKDKDFFPQAEVLYDSLLSAQEKVESSKEHLLYCSSEFVWMLLRCCLALEHHLY